jgi:ribose transport system ATP-binding protein
LLEVEQIRGKLVDGVSLSASRGQILGVTGLAGMGQDELPYLIAGATRPSAGKVSVGGVELRARSPRDALLQGLVLVPANRQRDGAWLSATATENITLPTLGDHFRGGMLRKRGETKLATELMAQFDVRPLLPKQPVGSFSGGNQQKIVLAKWLQGRPQVLLLHEPTQGVDAGAKKEILEIVKRIADAGAAVVIFSADYEELASVAHRVLILHDGRLRHELVGGEVSQDRILEFCNVQRPAAEVSLQESNAYLERDM